MKIKKTKWLAYYPPPIQYQQYMKRGSYGSYDALPDWKRQQIGFPAAKAVGVCPVGIPVRRVTSRPALGPSTTRPPTAVPP